MTYTGGYSSGFTGGGNYGTAGQYGNQTAGAGYQGGLGNLAGQAGAMYGGNFGGRYGGGFNAGYGGGGGYAGGFNPAGIGAQTFGPQAAAAAGSVGGAGGDVTSAQDTASAVGNNQQQQGQQPGSNQQQSFQQWFRSLQNPGAWTPGGSAQAAGNAPTSGASQAGMTPQQVINQNFGDWATPVNQNASVPADMASRGIVPPTSTGEQGLTAQPQAPSDLGAGGSGNLGGQGPDLSGGTAPTSVAAQNVPQTSQQQPITTGDTSSTPSNTSQNEDPTTQQQQGGQQGQQQQQGQQGGRGGNPLAQLFRRMGLPGPLAQLAAMAMQQGMMRGRGFPGRFPFRGGMPGMMGRGRGRGRFGMRGGMPMGFRGSPLTPFQGGGQPGGQQGFPFQAPGQAPGAAPDQTGGQQQPGQAGAQAPQFAPDDAELAQAAAGQGGPAAPAPGQANWPVDPLTGRRMNPAWVQAGQQPQQLGQAPQGPYPGTGVRSNVANTMSAGGMSSNAIAGIMANISSESGWNAGSRVADQPRWSGEAHFAHGLYQEGGQEWINYQRWLGRNGQDWRTAWRNPVLQTQFLTQNLKQNYPQVWQAMNNARTPGEAANIFMRGYLRPAAMQAAQRSMQYRRGVPSILQQLAQQQTQ